MASSLRWSNLCFALVLVAPLGCQRVPGGDEDDDASPDSMSAGNLDDEGGGGGTFLSGNDSDGDPMEDDDQEPAECNVVTQTGCTGNEKCAVTSSGGSVDYRCVLDPALFDPLATCEPSLLDGADGCPAAYGCLGEEGAGVCVGLCLVEADCAGGLCLQDPNDNVPHCATECDPFEPSCVNPLQCRRKEDRYACQFGEEADVGVEGAPCTFEGDSGCAAGFSCVNGALLPNCDGDRCCTPLCDLAAVDTCSAPTTCATAIDAPAPGFEEVGACYVPT